jgi:hypothetical protein
LLSLILSCPYPYVPQIDTEDGEDEESVEEEEDQDGDEEKYKTGSLKSEMTISQMNYGISQATGGSNFPL